MASKTTKELEHQSGHNNATKDIHEGGLQNCFGKWQEEGVSVFQLRVSNLMEIIFIYLFVFVRSSFSFFFQFYFISRRKTKTKQINLKQNYITHQSGGNNDAYIAHYHFQILREINSSVSFTKKL